MSTLTKEDELCIVRELVKDPDSYNFYAKIKKPMSKHDTIKTGFWFLITGFFCGIFGWAFSDFTEDMWMPKQATNVVYIVTTGAMWLGIFLMLFGVYIGVRHPIEIPDKDATDYAQKAVNNLGLPNTKYTHDCDANDEHDKDMYQQNIYSLIVFNINIGKLDCVNKILADYQDLKVLKHRLLIAQNVEANGYQVDNDAGSYILECEYAEKTQELLDRLYLLAQSRVNKLGFELVKQDKYQYLPRHMRKGLVERFYDRLLKLVGSD